MGGGVGEVAFRKLAGRQCACQLCEDGMSPGAGTARLREHASSDFAAGSLGWLIAVSRSHWVCALQSFPSEHACKEYHTRSSPYCLELQ